MSMLVLTSSLMGMYHLLLNSGPVVSSGTRHLTATTCRLQSVWRGAAACREFQAVMRQLLEDVRMTGPPSEDDTSVAAHLLRLKAGPGLPPSVETLSSSYPVHDNLVSSLSITELVASKMLCSCTGQQVNC